MPIRRYTLLQGDIVADKRGEYVKWSTVQRIVKRMEGAERAYAMAAADRQEWVNAYMDLSRATRPADQLRVKHEY